MADELVRFIVPARCDEDSHAPIGVMQAAYDLLEDGELAAGLRTELEALVAWVEQHVPAPARLNRTSSKGWYRRTPRGISWLRLSATQHVSAFRALSDVVARCGLGVAELRETRVGYIVYEDDIQVVAEPFRDTRTS